MSQSLLWTPDPERAAETQLARFMAAVSADTGETFSGYADFHRWSVENREDFWVRVWDFCGLVGERGERVLSQDSMPGAVFFPDARINFAENLMAPGAPRRWTRGRRRGDGLLGRGQGAPPHELARA